MQHQKTTLTAIVCQTSPFFKETAQSIASFKDELKNYTPEDRIDIVIFPEMSFTGYNFKDKDDVMPVAVNFGEGP